MRLRRVLHTGAECRTVWIGTKVQQLEIVVVLLAEGDSRCAPPDRIDVEFDCAAAERDALQYCVAAIQSHQAVKKPQLSEEFGVFPGLPLVSGHTDRPGLPGARARHVDLRSS